MLPGTIPIRASPLHVIERSRPAFDSSFDCTEPRGGWSALEHKVELEMDPVSDHQAVQRHPTHPEVTTPQDAASDETASIGSTVDRLGARGRSSTGAVMPLIVSLAEVVPPRERSISDTEKVICGCSSAAKKCEERRWRSRRPMPVRRLSTSSAPRPPPRRSSSTVSSPRRSVNRPHAGGALITQKPIRDVLGLILQMPVVSCDRDDDEFRSVADMAPPGEIVVCATNYIGLGATLQPGTRALV